MNIIMKEVGHHPTVSPEHPQVCAGPCTVLLQGAPFTCWFLCIASPSLPPIFAPPAWPYAVALNSLMTYLLKTT